MLKLKNLLVANSIFTSLCAITLFLNLSTFNALFGLKQTWILPTLAIGLLVYAFDLLMTSRSRVINDFKAKYFIAMDAFWVIGSGILIIVFQSQFSLSAILIIDAIALIVGIFGFLQYLAYRKVKETKKV